MIKFVHPSTWMVGGPSQSGKTHFVSRVLTSGMIEPHPSRIVWAYSIWQPAYDNLKQALPNIEFHKGLDQELVESFDPNKVNLIVLDDLMTELGKGSSVGDMFTRGSHHLNLSTIYIVQNIFNKGASQRTCNLNSHYTVVFSNPRDATQLRFVGGQMFPKASRDFLPDSLKDSGTFNDRAYLVLDNRTETPDEFRVRTCVFPGEQTRIYKPLENKRK